MGKPRTIAEYIEWARSTLSVDFDDTRSKNLYTTNLQFIFNTVSEHIFFRELDGQLAQWSEEYENKTSSQLLMDKSTFALLIKNYESAVDKSFRNNIILNENFPKPPKKGWVTPENLFKCLNDGVRGALVCKFIDGPSFLSKKLTEDSTKLGLKSRRYSQERDEGYYAYHFYAEFKVDLLDKNWQKQESEVEIEIQITTQLQEVLRSLTHQFYEQKRLQPESDKSKWKWDYMSNQFRTSYLSHTLHLLEAIIVQARDHSREVSEDKGKGE